MSIFKFTTKWNFKVCFLIFRKKKWGWKFQDKTKINSQVEVQCDMNLHKLRKREVSITWSQNDVWTNHKAHHITQTWKTPTISCYIIYFVTNVGYIEVIKNFIIFFGSENSWFLSSYESQNSHIQVPIEELWKCYNKL
jgi:hypothetical protein